MINFYFFIGTKAQAIKSISLMKLISSDKNCNLNLVDSGQHFLITEKIFESLNNYNLFKLHNNLSNVSTYRSGILWVLKFIFNNLILKNKYINNDNKNLCVIHGDTVSTLLGLLWGKRNSLEVVHLESGLTSKSILNPFPEEIIRRIVSRYSNILICFDTTSETYLNDKFDTTKKDVVLISNNTIIDTLFVNEKNQKINQDLITVTLHRNENLIFKKRILKLIELLKSLDESFQINWYMHEPTENVLSSLNFQQSKNIQFKPLLNHDEFIDQIKKSFLVITDGGSIQEECFYLNKNAVIWRKNTERPYAMNDRILISKYDIDDSLKFIKNLSKNYIDDFKQFKSPSKEIYEYIISKYS